MDFVIAWLCYLAAFVAGSAAACLIVTIMVKRAVAQRDSVDVVRSGVGAGR